MESRRKSHNATKRISGLVEYDMVCQVTSEISPHMYLTTSMYQQVIPGSVDDMIPPDNDDDVREGIEEEPEDQSENRSLVCLEKMIQTT